MELYDLHTHSYISDGTLSPAELVQEAHKSGLTALALTDHDATFGCTEAADEAARLGIKLIPGVEISAADFHELHILGLGIDINSEGLKVEMEKCAKSRRERVYKICDVLKEMGIVLDPENIIRSAKYSVGKPHIAIEIARMGYAKDKDEAYDKYLKTPEVKAVKKYKISCKTAAKLIHEAGGKVVLAHPHKIELEGISLEEFIRDFEGLDGIEAFYSEHTHEQAKELLEYAEKYNLLISCGSDFHGSNKPDIKLGTGIIGTDINGTLVSLRKQFPVDEERMIVSVL